METTDGNGEEEQQSFLKLFNYVVPEFLPFETDPALLRDVRQLANSLASFDHGSLKTTCNKLNELVQQANSFEKLEEYTPYTGDNTKLGWIIDSLQEYEKSSNDQKQLIANMADRLAAAGVLVKDNDAMLDTADSDSGEQQQAEMVCSSPCNYGQ